nr:hypothetical protein [Tanacetum cinerariifolium]
TARPEVSAATPSTPLTTTTIFGDEDLTIAQTLIKMRSEKVNEKGVSFRDVKEPPRLTRSTTTLQPLLTIDLNDKGKGVQELQMLYEREKKWIDDFVPMNFEKEEKKSVEHESKDKKGKRIKRVADSAPKQKSSKKQKMMQEQESSKNEEDIVDLEILSTKYPIVDWESQILGNVDMEDKHVYKIIRANMNTSYHKSLSSMLRKFDIKDLVDLHRLVMKIFKENTPEDWNLISWKLYENCGIHTLVMDGTLNCFNMLVEKRYPLIKEMLEKMLNWKLEAKAESTMAFELLKFIKS